MTEVNMRTIQVGQRVYSGLYGGRDGIVFRVNGDQAPETIGRLGGIMSYGGRATMDVVFENHLSYGIPESIIRGVQWEIYDEVASPDEIMDWITRAKDAEAMKSLQEKAASDRRVAEREEYARKYPELLKHADRPNWSGVRLAAENIRRTLKKQFPGVKFSVKMSTFSGGNEVRVSWVCGPTTKMVEPFVERHQGGHFNGMEDIYESDYDATFADVFGKAKYTFCSRDYPDAEFEKCCRDLCEIYKVEFKSTHETVVDGRYVGAFAGAVCAQTELPNGLHGIKAKADTEKALMIEDYYEAY